jgi:(p)ppGpp synthase/HD superfamily hydrolase
MNNQINIAKIIAKTAHAGQKYGMKPYFSGHVEKVVERVTSSPDSLYGHVVVAYLHDIVEDTDISLADLRDLGFDADIIDAVDTLTRRKDAEPYFSYIKYIASKKDSFALLVKIADVKENLENSTISGPASLAKRYKKALTILTAET